MNFRNTYENKEYAEAYAQLRFPGTYFLAFRDLPSIFKKHVHGNKALDFGCGSGRSTRFLRECGFHAIGIDIAPEMLAKAREFDPEGAYQLIEDGNYGNLDQRKYDLVFCAFPFDNIPNGHKARLLAGLSGLLRDNGKVIILGSTPEIYLHEWMSFSNSAFPENKNARDGDTVRIINTATADLRPVEDILCTDKMYRELFCEAGLTVVEMYKPLALASEPFAWVNETAIAPWVIYVLAP